MAKVTQTQSKPPGGKTISRIGISSRELAGLTAFFLVPALLQTIWSGRLQQWLPVQLWAHLPSTSQPLASSKRSTEPTLLEICRTHTYSTEIVSLDPLMIYINNFTTHAEAEALIKLGEADFEDSFISRRTGNQKVSGRTSQSAPIDTDHPLTQCILGRARTFMGSMLQPHEPFSIPQLVRYFPSQRYDLHTDFWPQHQIMNDGSGRLFNRPASFFVFLRDNCTEGETYFPSVDALDKDAERGGNLEAGFKGKVQRGERDGVKKGVKVTPLVGSAVFWVNIPGEDGVGDRRLVHAGLPVGEGEKIGMNLWPRKFYGYD